MTTPVRSRRRAYYDWRRYPHLAELQANWPAILEEARQVFRVLGPRMDALAGPSYILPLIPEPEDSNVMADIFYSEARANAPLTTKLVTAIPYVVAFAFSRVAPQKHIPEHDHWNPYLVALVCLQDGGGSYLIVGGERHDFKTGEVTLFDYTLPHEVKNEGTEERIVLLVVIDPKRAQQYIAPEPRTLTT